MFNAAKDAFTSRAAQSFINQRIARYGEVQSLKLDSRAKTIEVVCQLQGEVSPITVRVERYEIIEEGGEKRVRLGACTCSRPWLENVLNDFGRGREVPLPPWAAAAL